LKLILCAIHPAHLRAFEYLFGPFGGALMPQNIHKGPKMGRMNVPMSKLEIEPLTKSIGPTL
jgi:hypothetical protein